MAKAIGTDTRGMRIVLLESEEDTEVLYEHPELEAVINTPIPTEIAESTVTFFNQKATAKKKAKKSPRE